MKQIVEKTLLNECKADKNSKILVAVSGGADSVALSYVFKEIGINFALAHCNFQLRNEASNEDEIFVEKLAKDLGVPFFSTKFETNKYVEENKVSVQVAARDLRYEWLETIRKKEEFQFIATAHHANDQAETIFMNLIKGTGLDGLRGMKFKNNYLIRPMLKLEKSELLAFTAKNNIQFREDESNKSTKYTRNNIRLNMLPVAETVNPNFYTEMNNFSQRISEIQAVYKLGIEQTIKKILKPQGNDFYIAILQIEKHEACNTILFEILKQFNFSNKQIIEAQNLLAAESGKQICSETHRLLKDRKHLIITALENIDSSSIFQIHETREKLQMPDFLMDICLKNAEKYSPEYRAKVAVLDAEKVVFPLTIRRWKAGDYFYPFGMTKYKSDKVGKKKLKKFFADLKLSIRDKERVWVVQDAKDRIIWVVGLRTDARFMVQPATKKILRLKLTNVAKDYLF